MSDHKLDRILTALRGRMERVYGERLVRMVLYGSRARGDAESGSDIDILIVLAGTVDPGEEISRTGGLIADLSLQFGEVISCVFIDEERFMHRQGPFLRNVRIRGHSRMTEDQRELLEEARNSIAAASPGDRLVTFVELFPKRPGERLVA